jgi:hypothetical protein
VSFDVTDEGWLPSRGDYGAHYASDLIPLIEATTCHRGCVKAGDEATRAEFGPGGNCELLAYISAPERVKEIQPRDDGPHCTVRVDPATVGMEPLFGVTP